MADSFTFRGRTLRVGDRVGTRTIISVPDHAVAADVADAIEERRVDAPALSSGLTRDGRPFARARAV